MPVALLLAGELGDARAVLQPSDWLDTARLSRGEVQVHSVRDGEFSGRVLAAIQIDASQEAEAPSGLVTAITPAGPALC